MEINLADFVSDDLDNPASPTSYAHFIRVITNTEPLQHINIHLNKADVLQAADVFFKYLNPYCPILFKPDFVNMVSATCDPGIAKAIHSCC